MTSRERLLCVMQGRVPDMVPVFVRGVSPFGENMNWMGRHHPSYERLRALVLEHTDIFHAIAFDSGLWLTSADVPVSEQVTFEDEDWRDEAQTVETPRGPLRSVIRRSKHNLYEVMETEFPIKDAADFDRFMSIPYEPVRPDARAVAAEKDREVGDHGLTTAGIPSPIMYLHSLLGSEGLALWSVFERDRLAMLLETLRDRLLGYVSHLIDEGVGPVFSYAGPEVAVPPLMSPKDFHEFVTIVDKPVHELIHSRGCYTWVHCHGTLDKVLEEFLEMGTDLLEPLEAPPGGDVALSDAKRRIGDDIILMGNMPYEAIISWDSCDIEKRVEADCRAAAAGGGFILMPAASPFETVLTDKAFDGYRSYISAARKYGRY